MTLYQKRLRSLAALSQSHNVSSCTLNGVPHRNTVQNCELLVVLPYNAALHSELKAYAQKFGSEEETDSPWIAPDELFSKHVLAAVRAFSPSLPACSTRPYFHLISDKVPNHSLPYLLCPEVKLTTEQYASLQSEIAAHLHTPDMSTASLLAATGGLPYIQALPLSVGDLYKERPVTSYSALLDLRDALVGTAIP
jgi:hypothetical protein